MIDFGEMLRENNKHNETKIDDPIEIYRNLDRKTTTGDLRTLQREILEKWYIEHREKKELIIKLHTGVGKTLIGLLILNSRLVGKNEPCIYVCPNKYLMEQVCKEAKKFGIEYCKIDNKKKGDGQLPQTFVDAEKILITYAQKVFNGKSVFEHNAKALKVGTFLMDDSHSCVDVIEDAFTINIQKNVNNELYSKLLKILEDSLVLQGEGTFKEIERGDSDKVMIVPYWDWSRKYRAILDILIKDKKVENIQFPLQLLKDNLSKCRVFINREKIEISPYYIDIGKFPAFNKARDRILMSATTQNDMFLIKGLGFAINTIKEPLINENKKWYGEKMILVPTLIDERYDRYANINFFSNLKKQKFGIVVLTPSNYRSNEYISSCNKNKDNITIVGPNTIYEDIENLRGEGGEKAVTVIANRYDGIDLPDDSCRVLIFDSMPYFNRLSERYEESCREGSEIINKKRHKKLNKVWAGVFVGKRITVLS